MKLHVVYTHNAGTNQTIIISKFHLKIISKQVNEGINQIRVTGQVRSNLTRTKY